VVAVIVVEAIGAAKRAQEQTPAPTRFIHDFASIAVLNESKSVCGETSPVCPIGGYRQGIVANFTRKQVESAALAYPRRQRPKFRQFLQIAPAMPEEARRASEGNANRKSQRPQNLPHPFRRGLARIGPSISTSSPSNTRAGFSQQTSSARCSSAISRMVS
jgi:hypothetical protein